MDEAEGEVSHLTEDLVEGPVVGDGLTVEAELLRGEGEGSGFTALLAGEAVVGAATLGFAGDAEGVVAFEDAAVGDPVGSPQAAQEALVLAAEVLAHGGWIMGLGERIFHLFLPLL